MIYLIICNWWKLYASTSVKVRMTKEELEVLLKNIALTAVSYNFEQFEDGNYSMTPNRESSFLSTGFFQPRFSIATICLNKYKGCKIEIKTTAHRHAALILLLVDIILILGIVSHGLDLDTIIFSVLSYLFLLMILGFIFWWFCFFDAYFIYATALERYLAKAGAYK